MCGGFAISCLCWQVGAVVLGAVFMASFSDYSAPVSRQKRAERVAERATIHYAGTNGESQTYYLKEVSVMGDRVMFVFPSRQDNSAVVLYSHWGRTDWKDCLQEAISHASPRLRLDDDSYALRMIICSLMNQVGAVMSETGFGIYAVPDYKIAYFGEDTVIVKIGTREILFEDLEVSDLFEDWKPVSKKAGVL